MSDARSRPVPKPKATRPRWTSFVATVQKGRAIRGLQEEGNSLNRVKVTHNLSTLLVHISDEDGKGWTTVAIDRDSREWAIAQRPRQLDSAETACGLLYADA
jgi:hypothetical protein